MTANENDASQQPNLHTAIGGIVTAATGLELALGDAVVGLTRSPLTDLVVQGERGSALIGMARRLLDHGIGSSEEDETSGRTQRLNLISAQDTAAFHEVLKDAERLLRARDEVVHSDWLWLVEEDQRYVLEGHRKARSRRYARRWTFDELERLRQEMMNARVDLFICSWNTSGAPLDRMEPRVGDVR